MMTGYSASKCVFLLRDVVPASPAGSVPWRAGRVTGPAGPDRVRRRWEGRFPGRRSCAYSGPLRRVATDEEDGDGGNGDERADRALRRRAGGLLAPVPRSERNPG